jgi:DNA invertase Pin-like site-specific DNA recombinase
VRRSSTKQEKSLADQRSEIEKYAAANGYSLVRWYEDDAISGDDTDKRTAFLSMHAAGCNPRRDFNVILVWDIDRFGRFNSIEAGFWIHPLMRAGIQLATVTEGPVNWNSFTDRVVYSLKQEGKHQYLIDLSRTLTRGRISTAQQGFLCGQAAPYGYDRMLVDEHGEHRQRVRNGEVCAKPRDWRVTLVPADDPAKVELVQWLFATYANEFIGLRTLADQLNSRGARGPRGGAWHVGTIREILRNEAYVGTFVYAKRRMGKYSRVVGGDVGPREDFHRLKVQRNPEHEQIRTENAHPPLVERETWERVQQKLGERKTATTPRRKANEDRYLLSGLVFCGHCNGKMYGTAKSKQKAGRDYLWAKYICSTYMQSGRSAGCGYHSVDQGALLAVVVDKLRTAILGGGQREKLEQRVIERLRRETDCSGDEVRRIRQAVEVLSRQIDQGAERLLRAPDDLSDLLIPKLTAMKREREQLERQLQDAKQAGAPRDITEEARRIVEQVLTLDQELGAAPPARVRELLRRAVGRVNLWFEHVQRGKRVECPLVRGEIVLRRDPLFFGLVSRDDRI